MAICITPATERAIHRRRKHLEGYVWPRLKQLSEELDQITRATFRALDEMREEMSQLNSDLRKQGKDRLNTDEAEAARRRLAVLELDERQLDRLFRELYAANNTVYADLDRVMRTLAGLEQPRGERDVAIPA